MRKRKTYTKSLGSWAPQGRRLGDDRLEVLVLPVAPGELLHVAGNWAAVEYIQRRKKRVEEASVSTQLVLNKYNTNYKALRLADSTALDFKSWQSFIKANYYRLVNYHKPSYIEINKFNYDTSENHTKPTKTPR